MFRTLSLQGPEELEVGVMQCLVSQGAHCLLELPRFIEASAPSRFLGRSYGKIWF